ncbi:MAG TPA: helix-turn-helix domain-containing protein [Macromonas sp.]|nr:helix-turn-helix domain-containing protein [Macromonas sp.]
MHTKVTRSSAGFTDRLHPPAGGLDVLLDSAASQFARFGLSGVSMRDIGREVGYTAPLICYHFATKDNLYLEAFSHKMEQTMEQIAERLDRVSDPGRRYVVLVEALYDLFVADSDLLALAQRDIIDASNGQRPLLSRRQFQHFNAMIRQLATEFTGAEVSERTAFAVTALVFGYCLMSNVRRSLGGGGAEAAAADRAELIRQAVKLVAEPTQ